MRRRANAMAPATAPFNRASLATRIRAPRRRRPVRSGATRSAGPTAMTARNFTRTLRRGDTAIRIQASAFSLAHKHLRSNRTPTAMAFRRTGARQTSGRSLRAEAAAKTVRLARQAVALSRAGAVHRRPRIVGKPRKAAFATRAACPTVRSIESRRPPRGGLRHTRHRNQPLKKLPSEHCGGPRSRL